MNDEVRRLATTTPEAPEFQKAAYRENSRAADRLSSKRVGRGKPLPKPLIKREPNKRHLEGKPIASPLLRLHPRLLRYPRLRHRLVARRNPRGVHRTVRAERARGVHGRDTGADRAGAGGTTAASTASRQPGPSLGA